MFPTIVHSLSNNIFVGQRGTWKGTYSQDVSPSFNYKCSWLWHSCNWGADLCQIISTDVRGWSPRGRGGRAEAAAPRTAPRSAVAHVSGFTYAHYRQGISMQLPTTVTPYLAHPRPIKSESLGLKYCCFFLQVPQGDQEAKRSGLMPGLYSSNLSLGHMTITTYFLCHNQRFKEHGLSKIACCHTKLSVLQMLLHLTSQHPV